MLGFTDTGHSLLLGSPHTKLTHDSHTLGRFSPCSALAHFPLDAWASAFSVTAVRYLGFNLADVVSSRDHSLQLLHIQLAKRYLRWSPALQHVPYLHANRQPLGATFVIRPVEVLLRQASYSEPALVLLNAQLVQFWVQVWVGIRHHLCLLHSRVLLQLHVFTGLKAQVLRVKSLGVGQEQEELSAEVAIKTSHFT